MYSVLIVDDEKISRVAFRNMLDWAASGFDLVGTASDGIEALSMIERFEPDIVITDLVMPRMNGIELIKKLKKMEYDGKIIVISNYQEFELVREALKLGAMDYLLKTEIKKEKLSDLLNMAVNSSEETRELKPVKK